MNYMAIYICGLEPAGCGLDRGYFTWGETDGQVRGFRIFAYKEKERKGIGAHQETRPQ